MLRAIILPQRCKKAKCHSSLGGLSPTSAIGLYLEARREAYPWTGVPKGLKNIQSGHNTTNTPDC